MGMPGQPISRTRAERPVFVFNRDARFGYRDALNYQIVVNWFIAEHKSQGLFQTDSGKHQLEQFWLFEASGRDADSRARELAARLTPAAHRSRRFNAPRGAQHGIGGASPNSWERSHGGW
jgi:hypothetical protein